MTFASPFSLAFASRSRAVGQSGGQTVRPSDCQTVRLSDRRTGFTLVEVLLASLILGIGLTVLLSSLSVCLRTMRLAHDYERAQWVFGLGELTYPEPLQPSTDVTADYTVDADASLVEGYVFARTVDEKKEEDKEKNPLYVVHVRVGWGESHGDEQTHDELVRYVWERPK